MHRSFDAPHRVSSARDGGRLALAAALLVPCAALAQSFAVVYTGSHYVVDLLIGAVYATGVLFGVRWVWRRLELPE